MAASRGRPSNIATRHISSEDFVESCGAILFDITDPQALSVCLIHTRPKREWLLAKGRRNYGESRHEAAIREVTEETGYRCHVFPVTMPTRATPPEAPAIFPDKARVFDNLTEPFTCEIREYKAPKRTKIIWWYIAALDRTDEMLPGEPNYEPHFLPISQAITTLTYNADRKLVARAAQLVSDTLKVPLNQTAASPNQHVAARHSLNTGEFSGNQTREDLKAANQSKKGVKRKRNHDANGIADGAIKTPTNDGVATSTIATATASVSEQTADQQGDQQPREGNRGSKRKPKNCTPEELAAFKESKKERVKAKKAARQRQRPNNPVRFE